MSSSMIHASPVRQRKRNSPSRSTRTKDENDAPTSTRGSTPQQLDYIWIPVDLVEYVLAKSQSSEGSVSIPTHWQPNARKRNRAASTTSSSPPQTPWGWCRAVVLQQSTVKATTGENTVKSSSEISPLKKTTDENAKDVLPFGQFTLRKVAISPPVALKPYASTAGHALSATPVRSAPIKKPLKPRPAVAKTVAMSIRVHDEEFAPRHLQGTTISFVYNTTSDSIADASDQKSWIHRCNDWWFSSLPEPPSDLTQLEQLHEPAVLYCLYRRYAAPRQPQIYTYTGKILIAINPFTHLPHLYGEDVMQMYHSREHRNHPDASLPPKRSSLPPHIYAVAQDAYGSAVFSLQSEATKRAENQCILVSGESGAGKTVTTKIILQYLAISSQQIASDHRPAKPLSSGPTNAPLNGSVRRIELQVLESNPILESFGNARTIRNDNSSRFGKFMEMQFDPTGCLVSATIETYLLEKVRLISQSKGERNYHIFYEVLAPPLSGGLSPQERRALHVTGKTVRDFHMTCISDTFDRRDSVKDRDTYRELRNALDVVGFSRQEQFDLFTVVCALLYTSNLTFIADLGTSSSGDASSLDVSNHSLRCALELLGVDLAAFNNALCTCSIEARGETLVKQLPMDRAIKAVEAFIKTTYTALFSYIVRKINGFIAVQPQQVSHIESQTSIRETVSIGVLDIFGFESFHRNSFEQLCINYCNEALQQQFNRYVFVLEQQEYEREGIDWWYISFPDNQDVLDLIEKRHDGILSILDEQSRLPRCTDATFANAVYQKCSGNSRFDASKAMQAQFSFAIQHYAGLVTYETEGFIEKNQDELPKSTTELLQSSSNPFFATLGRELSHSCETIGQSPLLDGHNRGNKQLQRASSSLLRDSVGTQFSSQLKLLRSRIESTIPHYVRCLKPNDDLIPNAFDSCIIADQLRCAGVLEAIRVSRVGFPHRFFHDHFIHRYGLLERTVLAQHVKARASNKEICHVLVNLLSPRLFQLLELPSSMDEQSALEHVQDEGMLVGLEVGNTKVFIQSRAYEFLQQMRGKKLKESAILIQRNVRTFLCRIKYEIIIFAACLIQKYVRGYIAFRFARVMKIDHSAKVIQRAIRCAKARNLMRAARCIAIWCQSAIRGAIARQYCAYLFLDLRAAAIQQAWKKYKASYSLRKIRRAMICIQTRYRCKVAARELRRLRMEARDLIAVVAERDRYRDESNRLKRELEQVKSTPEKFIPYVKPPQSPGRGSEIEKLRMEVHDLQLEIDKFHRMSSPSISVDERAELLAEELASREAELAQLRLEVAALRSKDDISSTMKSMTIDTSMRDSFSGGWLSASNLSFVPSPRHRASPVRSDVSLLDDEIDAEIVSRQTLEDCNADTKEESDGNDELQHLHSAIRQKSRRHLDQVMQKTSEVCVLINQGDKYGRTAMHLAAIGLDIEIAEVLLSRGAVVNAQDDDGETPLHLAENAGMTELLIRKGKANPNIPNVDGICALHLAVQRRDIDSVRILVMNHANVNNADNIRWFTPLHLVALPARVGIDDQQFEDDIRCRIAELLTGGDHNVDPDLNYQDSEGNTPLHYAVQLESDDAYNLVNLLLDRNANPNVQNSRGQVPFHLLCHNEKLRSYRSSYAEVIHSFLIHGADPSIQSQTGCTALHLALYHKDVETAVILVTGGAELHAVWKKPKRWETFWSTKHDTSKVGGVLALDMVENEADLRRILSAITTSHPLAPIRTFCMQCKFPIRSSSQLSKSKAARHCRHCSRFVCTKCCKACLPNDYFVKNVGTLQESSTAWACVVCEKILTSRKEVMSNGTQPTTTTTVSYENNFFDDIDDDRYSC